MVVLDDQDRVLLMWRHRFIIDRWVWELPGGHVGSADAENLLCVATGAEYIGEPEDINEAERVAWVELGSARRA